MWFFTNNSIHKEEKYSLYFLKLKELKKCSSVSKFGDLIVQLIL